MSTKKINLTLKPKGAEKKCGINYSATAEHKSRLEAVLKKYGLKKNQLFEQIINEIYEQEFGGNHAENEH